MKDTVKIIQGTNHFPFTACAVAYYKPYNPDMRKEELRVHVLEKIAAGEIHIGKPPLKAGQELRIIDNRYHIAE